MQCVRALMALLILAPVLAAVLWCWGTYRRDLQASRLVLTGASGIAETPCGPIEYAEAGDGARCSSFTAREAVSTRVWSLAGRLRAEAAKSSPSRALGVSAPRWRSS